MKKKLLSMLLALCMALTLVTAAFAADASAAPATTAAKLPFTDVASGSWYYDAVSYAHQNKLFTGTDATTFSPNVNMSRAMLVSVLYSLAGKPAVTGADTALWYGAAAKWAKDSGISDGTNMTAPVSREQLVTMLYAYNKLQKLGMGRSEAYDAFKDASSVSAYAAETMEWAVGNGIIAGSNSLISPKANANRAQVAAILRTYLSGYSTKYNEKVVELASADGVKVPATVAVPTTVPAGGCAGVVMLHGTGSNREEAGNGYKTAAPVLAGKYGVATIRIDFRGNGDSKADYTQYTFNTAVEDAVAAASANSASATHFIDGMDHTFNVFSEADLHSLMNAIDATGAYFQANLAK